MLLNRCLNTSFLHIKGHQDDAKDYQHLTRWILLNVIADHMVNIILVEFFAQEKKSHVR